LWKRVLERMSSFPARVRVARLMVELGLGVSGGGRVTCGLVEVRDGALAEAAGVDRRVVKETVKMILDDELLRRIFTGLRPAGALLAPISKPLGFGVVEIRADPSAVGVLAGATKVVADQGISIRQAVAEDPDLFPEPKLVLVLEKPLPGEAINSLMRIPSVHSVTTY